MTRTPRLRLAILISGRGSNMAAIADACAAGRIAADVAVVIADRASAGGLELAAARGLASVAIERSAYADRDAFEAALAARIDASGADLVVLAGFMRILGDDFVARYAGRMLNIHPSLLPKYKGLHTHRRALEARDAEHGCSVHFVTPELDGGPVVACTRLPIRAADDEAGLSVRVQACEHILYPRVIGWIAAGRLAWIDGRPMFDGDRLDGPLEESCDGATAN